MLMNTLKYHKGTAYNLLNMMKYQITEITVTIKVAEYIRDYRDVDKFIVYCKQCNRYNACWSCPPYDFDPTGCMMKHENAHIIGTKINIDKALLNECTGIQPCKDASYQILGEVRRSLDVKLLALEQYYPGSRAFFAGTCRLCELGDCTRIFGKRCIYPDKIRPSLEAFGFDISKTSSQLLNTELQWGSKERLPDYFVLVSALFTSRAIEKITWQ
jgi:predicted metal-binding protein